MVAQHRREATDALADSRPVPAPAAARRVVLSVMKAALDRDSGFAGVRRMASRAEQGGPPHGHEAGGRGSDLQQRRPPLVPVGGLLVRITEGQDPRLVEGASEELKAHGHAVGREAAGHGKGGRPG